MQIAQVYTDKQKKQTPGYANSMFVFILSQTQGVTQTQDTSACMSEVQIDCFLQPLYYILYTLSYLLF